MGLDMYLTKRSAAAKNEQDEMVACWRKANHIHGWFERNTTDGYIENCELYPVCKGDLKCLMAGFFFGSSEYDDDYFMDVDDTLEIIRKVYDALQDGDELFYHAWW